MKCLLFIDSEVAVPAGDVLPCVEDLAFGSYLGKLCASVPLNMAQRWHAIASAIRRCCAKLVVGVAREVPREIAVLVRDRGAVSGLDDAAAVLVDLLEEEGQIHASDIPAAFEQRIGPPIERGTDGMLELAEVVVVTVNNDRRVADCASLEAGRGFATDGLGEAEGEEANAEHETANDREQAHLLAPCTLLLRSADAEERQQEWREAAGEEVAVDEPGVFGTGSDVVEAAGSFLGGRRCFPGR